MRCHLATEVFQAATLYDEAKTKPADQPLTGLVWYSRLWYGMHSALKGNISKNSNSYISMQARAKQLDDWAALLEQQYGPKAWQQHCVSQQLLFDARAVTHGVLALTDWLDAQCPGFELRCSKCNQNAVENSFSRKRASGSNTNPSAIEVARLISSEHCANITSHLSSKSSYEAADDEASAEGSSELLMSQLAKKRQSEQVRLCQLDTLQPPDGAPAAEAQQCRAHLLAAAAQQQLQGHPVPAACLQVLGWCSEAAPAPAAQEVTVLWDSLCSATAAAVEASAAKDAADGLLDEHWCTGCWGCWGCWGWPVGAAGAGTAGGASPKHGAKRRRKGRAPCLPAAPQAAEAAPTSCSCGWAIHGMDQVPVLRLRPWGVAVRPEHVQQVLQAGSSIASSCYS
jgi:hypothetical protein